MTRLLLTGGSGFIGAHILDSLLKHGYSVVATVRSTAKGEHILASQKQYGKDQLDYVVVENMMSQGGRPLSQASRTADNC